MSELRPSSRNPQEIHIPNFGGPLIETTRGDHIQIELADDFEFDRAKPSGRGFVTLAGCLLTTVGMATGWLGHAMLFG